MTKRLLALGAAGLLVVGLSACSSSDDDSSSDTTATTAASSSGGDYGGSTDTTAAGSTDTTAADASDTPGEPTAPVIEGFAFSPDPINITTGDTVTWTNNDSTAHTVTADDDSFDSGNIDPGDTFDQTFDQAGTFTYHCNIHSSMTGTVTVTD